MTADQRARFDRLLEDALGALPPRIRALVDEVPVIVMDEPTPEMVAELKRDGVLEAGDDGLDICGLHTGIGRTERSIDDIADASEQIHLFRRGIVDLAEGFDGHDADERIYEEIRITLLHEIGHAYGLDEDELDELGYA